MNKHILGDKLFLLVTNTFGKPFFRLSSDTPLFDEHMRKTTVEIPPFNGEGTYDVSAATLAGPLTAGFRVLHWKGPEASTLIYHQGGGEIPFDRTICKAYPTNAATDLNVIAVRTPCQNTLSELTESFAHFNTYLAMMASVIQLTEGLVQSEFINQSPFTLVCGYSLGGFVTNRHHLIYNSADAYVPIVAGTLHGEIFLSTVPAARTIRRRPHYIRDRLNFSEAWAQRIHENVFPVLARYDQLNRLDVQGPSYGDMDVTLWPGGHLYGANRPHLIREIIDSRVHQEIANRRQT